MKTYYGANDALTAVLASATRLALYSAAPGVNTPGTELSGNGYARQTVTWGSPVSGEATNTAQITFPAATGSSWLPVVAVGLLDVSGNIYFVQTISSLTCSVGQYIRVPVGALTVAEA